MADPKTNGPDPLRLLEAADAVLTRCEMRMPALAPDADRREARAAVKNAFPHVEHSTASKLMARLKRIENPDE